MSPQNSRSMPAFCRVLVAATGIVVGMLPPIPALTQALVSNLSDSSNGFISLSTQWWKAQAFRTDASGHGLADVQLKEFPLNASDINLSLYSDSAGSPGSAIATFSAPSGSGPLYTFVPLSSVTLNASTTYWIVGGGQTNTLTQVWDFTNSSSYTGSGTIPANNAFANSFDGGGSWSVFALSQGSPQFQVDTAAASNTPEPGAETLLGVVVAFVGLISRKRMIRTKRRLLSRDA